MPSGQVKVIVCKLPLWTMVSAGRSTVTVKLQVFVLPQPSSAVT
jgi:hypothetical protein